MQWSDVTAKPSQRMLRQFAGLFLIVFVALGGWRFWNGQADRWAMGLVGLGIVVGTIGLLWPPAVRWLFTGWLIAAFPIGWTISWVVLALLFYGVFLPVGLVFRLMHRDVLRLGRRRTVSYWTSKGPPPTAASYFRQS